MSSLSRMPVLIPVGPAGPPTTGNTSAINDPRKAREFIRQRHVEYEEYVQTTRWILDTLEGAEAYKDGSYGVDARGKELRNLWRQQREYPIRETLLRGELGPNPFSSSLDEVGERRIVEDQQYETRRRRTPTPNYLSTLIEKMMSKIFKRPVRRDGPPDLLAWADNIDGRETSIGEWMQDTLMPLLIALGMIDLVFRRPHRPADEPAMFDDRSTAAPEQQCMVDYALPEDVLWWRLDYTGKYYVEVNVRERHIINGNEVDLICHWTHKDWTIYDQEGKVQAKGMHGFGVVPVVRIFDRRRYRREHSANSRMGPVCDLSREYYNEESELISNQTMQNCPLLEGPALAGADDPQTVPVGAGYMIRRERAIMQGEDTGHKYIAPQTGPAEFTRSRLQDLIGRMEAAVSMTAPAGMVGHQKGSIVAQSGVSKSYDQAEGSEYLAGVSRVGETAEYTVHYFALIVLRGSFRKAAADIKLIKIVYPKEFNLLSFDQFAAIVTTMVEYINSGLGKIPADEKATLRRLIRMKHPDMGPDDLKEIDKQIDTLVDGAVESRNVAQSKPPVNPNLAPAGPVVGTIPPIGTLPATKGPAVIQANQAQSASKP
jgi:hypothetical protein